MALRAEDFAGESPDRRDPEEILRQARMDRFEAMYRSAVAPAWRVANAVAGDPDDAADAVAEGFTRVLDTLLRGRLDGVVDLKLYSLAAVRNAARTGCRDRSRFSPEGVADQAVASGPGGHLAQKVSDQLARESFDSLPPHQREVLWLTAVEGMRPRQVSAVLGISANNASQIAVRARAALLERYIQAHVGRVPAGNCDFAVRNLGRYLAGKLPREAVSALEEHLDACRGCQSRLDQLDDLGLSMRRTHLPLPVILAGTTWLARRAHDGGASAPHMAEVAAVLPSGGHGWSGWSGLRLSLDSTSQLAVAANAQLGGAGRLATGAAAALIALGGTAALAPRAPETNLSPRVGSDQPVLSDQAAPAEQDSAADTLGAAERTGTSEGRAGYAWTPAPTATIEAHFGAALDPVAAATASGGGEVAIGPPGAGSLSLVLSADGKALDEGLVPTPVDLAGLPGDLLDDTLGPQPVRSTVEDTLGPQPVRSTVEDTLGPQPVRSTVEDTLGPQPVRSTVEDTLGPQPVRSTVEDTLGPEPVASTVEDTLGPQPVRSTVEGTLGPEPVRSTVEETLGPVSGPDAELAVTTTVGGALQSVLPL